MTKLKYVFFRDQTQWFWYNFRRPKTLNLKKQNSADRVSEYKVYLKCKDLNLSNIVDAYDDINVKIYYSKSWKDRYKIKRQYMKNL